MNAQNRNSALHDKNKRHADCREESAKWTEKFLLNSNTLVGAVRIQSARNAPLWTSSECVFVSVASRVRVCACLCACTPQRGQYTSRQTKEEVHRQAALEPICLIDIISH